MGIRSSPVFAGSASVFDLGLRNLRKRDQHDSSFGVVVMSAFQGLYEEYFVEFSGIQLRALQPAMQLRSGEEVDVFIARERVTLLRAGP